MNTEHTNHLNDIDQRVKPFEEANLIQKKGTDVSRNLFCINLKTINFRASTST